MFMHLWEIQHRNTIIKITMLFMRPANFLPWKDQVYSIVSLNLFEADSISKIMFLIIQTLLLLTFLIEV